MQDAMAWTFDVTERDCESLYAGNLAYRPEPAKVPVTIEPFARLPIEGGDMYFQRNDEAWIGKGAEYRVVWSSSNRWSNELKYPGSYKASIRALRAVRSFNSCRQALLSSTTSLIKCTTIRRTAFAVSQTHYPWHFHVPTANRNGGYGSKY